MLKKNENNEKVHLGNGSNNLENESSTKKVHG